MSSTVHDIKGPQNPLDRLGRPLHDLRISVMDRCNFRCPYCMPKEQFHEHYRFLKSQERLSFEEIVRLARLFASLGVRKLRLTGGEPLLRTNLADLIGDLTDIPGIDDIALTTNGVLLGQHAVDLHANGLRRVTVSLDTLDPDVYLDSEWVQGVLGKTVLDRLQGRSVACCGTTIGGREAMMDYLARMTKVILSHKYRPIDQAISNMILHLEIPAEKVVFHKNGEGVVLTLEGMDEKDVHLENGEIRFKGRTTAVVHMYDRMTETDALVKELYPSGE